MDPPPFPYDLSPKKPLEAPTEYISRITTARENISYIPKEKPPPPPSKETYPSASEYRAALTQYEAALRSTEATHLRKLTNGDPLFDAEYAKKWNDYKKRRRERNKEAREAAWLKRKVQDITLKRIPVQRPKSPESSGDELYEAEPGTTKRSYARGVFGGRGASSAAGPSGTGNSAGARGSNIGGSGGAGPSGSGGGGGPSGSGMGGPSGNGMGGSSPPGDERVGPGYQTGGDGNPVCAPCVQRRGPTAQCDVGTNVPCFSCRISGMSELCQQENDMIRQRMEQLKNPPPVTPTPKQNLGEGNEGVACHPCRYVDKKPGLCDIQQVGKPPCSTCARKDRQCTPTLYKLAKDKNKQDITDAIFAKDGDGDEEMRDASASPKGKGKGKAPGGYDPDEPNVDVPEDSVVEPSDAIRLTGVEKLSPNSKQTFQTIYGAMPEPYNPDHFHNYKRHLGETLGTAAERTQAIMPHTDDSLLFNFATFLDHELETLRPQLNARGIRDLEAEIEARRAANPPAPAPRMGVTVGSTITLPNIDVTRLLRQQTLANVYAGRNNLELRPWIVDKRYIDADLDFTCNEFKYHFTTDPAIVNPFNPREICGKRPSKACDTKSSQDHEYYCTCRACHNDQNRAYAHRQMRAIESTKLYACEPCSRSVQGGFIGERDFCLCTLQLRKLWFCHDHRVAHINSVWRAAFVNRMIIQQQSQTEHGILCPICGVNPPSSTFGVWGCIVCRHGSYECGCGRKVGYRREDHVEYRQQ